MSEHFVYLNTSPDGRVFYVGCGTTIPSKRGFRAQHQRAYSRAMRTALWTRAASNGFAVEIVFRSNNRDTAFLHEKAVIAECRARGEPLLNIADGGAGAPGVKDDQETRRKKSITKLGALNPMYGRTGARHPQSREVVDAATGATYPSVSIAADAIGAKMKSLYNMLSGHRPNKTNLRFA